MRIAVGIIPDSMRRPDLEAASNGNIRQLLPYATSANPEYTTLQTDRGDSAHGNQNLEPEREGRRPSK